jgi:hypothetical protein
MCSREFREALGNDLTEVAGFLSQFSAVLAGFAFAGVLLILDRFYGDDTLTRPVGALIASFMTLLIATFLYATVAGETTTTTRAATLNAVSGAIFATGLLMMVNGVTRMLIATRPTVPTGLLQLLVLAAPLTAITYLDTVTITLVSILDCDVLGVVSLRFGAIAAATIYLAALTGWLWWRWDAPARGLLAWGGKPHVQERYERIVVVSVVAVILLGAVVTRSPRDLHFPALVASLGPAVVAALLTVYTIGLQAHVHRRSSQTRSRSSTPSISSPGS